MKIDFLVGSFIVENPIIVAVYDKQDISNLFNGFLKDIDASEIVELAVKFGFSGEYEKVLPLLSTSIGVPIILIGIGDKKTFTPAYAHRIGILMFEQAQKFRFTNMHVILNPEESSSGRADYVRSMSCGLGVADFSMSTRYKKSSSDAPVTPHKVESAVVVLRDSEDVMDSSALNSLVDSIKCTKKWCCTPANLKIPEEFANNIHDELSPMGVKIEIFNEKLLTELKMNALLSVGQGSVKESRVVVMRWDGRNNKDDPYICLVGKGVVFDSGGISIKPAKSMEDMKFDMSGAAAVAGAIRQLACRKAPVNVVGIVGLVENMPSGSAVKPSDVVFSHSGKSIEVLNTDAEGRMVLADLLSYIQANFNSSCIVDLATLTGAITVALGNGIYGGLFSNDDDLAKKLLDCGNASGERLWRMPLDIEFDKAINSDIADMRNTSTISGAGSSTAAHFLMRFIEEGNKWAHLDIAGMAYRSSGLPLSHCRSVGFGVQLLDIFIRSFE